MATPRRNHYAPQNTWSEEQIVEAVRDWAREHGAPPKSYEWCPGTGRSAGLIGPGETAWEREHPRWPGDTTVYRYFSSWADLLEAAGFAPYQRMPPGPRSERIEAAQRLSASGMTNKAIAHELGLSEGTVSRYLRAHPCGCGAPVVGTGSVCHACATRAANPRRWTEAQIIDAFAEWARLEGPPPTQTDWRPAPEGAPPRRWDREFPRWPPMGAVKISFGTWNELRVISGFSAYNPPWTREEILDAIQRWHDEHGRSPAKNEWEVAPEGYPSAATVRRTFGGSFVKAVNAAGFAQAKRIWTRPMILEAIREFADRHGRLPRSSEWIYAAPGRPTRGTVVNRFGSWTAAMAISRPDQPG